MVLPKLAISNVLVRKVRTALTVGAIALSVSLVVAVTSGYRSVEAAAVKFLNQYMGAADAFVIPVNDFQGEVPESLVAELAKDPAVKPDRLSGRLDSERQLPLKNPPATQPTTAPAAAAAAAGEQPKTGDEAADDDTVPAGIFANAGNIDCNLVGIRRPQDTRIENLKITAGHWFDTANGNDAVIDQVAAAALGVHVGDTFTLPGVRPLTLKVVGRIHKPAFFAGRTPTIYLPLETLQHFTGQDHPPQVSRIAIDLKPDTNYQAFADRWNERLKQIDTNLKLRMRRDNAGELDKNLRGVHILSYLGGAVSMLTATFIIFTALSMGVTERQRTLAMLRAIGTTRWQVARLVVLEGFFLAVIGVCVGVPLGVFWVHLLYLRFTLLFAAGVVLNWTGILIAGLGSVVTALAASLLPAYTATRVSPLEAMNAFGSTATSDAPPWGWAIAGVVLAGLDPLIFFGPVEPVMARLGVADPIEWARATRFYLHFAIGLPGIMIGFFLLAPLFVWVVERVLGPLVALLAFLPYKMLRQQLSSGIWRAAGTCAALMVGLATLIAMQVQGNSMLKGWQLPDKFPDIFIYGPDPIPFTQLDKLAKVDGIKNHEVMPVVVTTPAGDSKLQLLIASQAKNLNTAVMFFGVYPDQALKMLQLDFRDADGKSLPRDQQVIAAKFAAEEMKKGRHIIVTDEFRQARGLKVGDQVRMLTSKNGMQSYTICGVVWSPGVDVIVSLFDMGRVLDQQTAGSVFGSIEDAQRDFGVTGARLFAADLEGGIQKEELLANIRKQLGDLGLKAGDVRQIKYFIETGFQRLLLLVSSVAFAALAVASLGVTNTVMASVRSRRWQFGVLRSIGVTRGELLRLVLAEAALLGLVGVALGTAAGVLMSIDARKLSGATLGYSPPLVFPWPIISIGITAVMAVSILASLWPAISVARAQPLDLLQAGRASA